MTDINIKVKLPPLSSRMVKSKSIPLLFTKINSERNHRKKNINNNSIFDIEFLNNENKIKFNRNISSSNLIISPKINSLNSNDFHENIYRDMKLNTHSLNNSILEIKQMIKEKKYNNFRNIYNMFFNTPFSNEYLNDFNLLKRKKILIKKRKNNFIQMKRNNSCEELINSKKNISYFIRNADYTPRLSTNNSKVLNTNFTIADSYMLFSQQQKRIYLLILSTGH